MQLRHVPPAGSPIRISDLARWMRRVAVSPRVDDDLCETICTRFGFASVALTCTGRAGLTLITEALGSLAGPSRQEVIVPSYTCFSVPASIVKAGLRPRMVDVDPETLDYDYEQLGRADFRQVAGIVATNLYGYPSNLPELSRIARAHGVFLVDDAAQAMGARLQGRYAGGWGDAGLLSFDKGKCVSAIDGGVLVLSNPAVSEAVTTRLARLPRTGHSETAAHMVKLAAYVAMLRPWLYWIPNGIPQLGLGETRYTTEFPLERPGRALAALARTMLDQLPSFAAHRRENARFLLAALDSVPGIAPPRALADSEPAFVRLPILVRDRATQQRVIATLRARGIGATGSYPTSLADVPALRPLLLGDDSNARGGRAVADRIVTLPTHPFVSAADRQRIVEALDSLGAADRVSPVGVTAR
jgi:perosamine synthetase